MLNTDKTIASLSELNLIGMKEAYEAYLTLPTHQMPTIHEFIIRLTEAELQHRKNHRTKMYLKLSGIRYDAVLENIVCSATRNLSRDQLFTLADCSFIAKAENILITGATGCGKSYFACAIGRKACSLGYKALYLGMNRFIEKLLLAKIEGTYIKLLNYLEKIPLLILDDFGITPLEHQVKIAILQLLEDRYGRKSTIITSQLPVNRWHQYINDPTIADAIMDRLSGSAHRMELKGESLRLKKQ
jgi:DNA replication protein DnaC